MIFKEELIESERLYEGAILNLRRDKVTASSGTAYREIVEHNGAVAIVALTEDNNIVMERQYRYACGRAILEIPAGKIDKGETDPVAAAVRELREETGYTASEIIHLGDCNPSCAYSEEVIHLYLMRGLTKGERELDDDEVIELIEMPFDEVYEMGVRGEIVDSKTLAALLMTKGRL
ncbi:MAG: NUDIX hydrolase [Firmicutes bacterium]|nr:NUDIX hydrolase [Bacillota bacterium]